ncbi:unnamed protein product [Linum tenue]|uniref:Peptidase A1 domain-containing protein n=1 Tax=Linum tenue TaxID=586396 RepID=A0AAV0K3A4_9ROSI|nr:unnamed protein product [Linum tenue]
MLPSSTTSQSPLLLISALLFPLLLHTLPAAAASSSYPDFQLFHLRSQTTLHHRHAPPTNTTTTSRRLVLDLLHRDQLTASNSTTTTNNNKTHHHELFHARIRRDGHRVASLLRRLHPNNDNDNLRPLEFGTEVVSGMEQGSGEYFVRIGVGSPPTSQYMVVDSGSDIVWVQCKPCSQCYPQSDPLFDPTISASFSGVSCSSAACDRLAAETSSTDSDRCRYEVSYGDGSYTKGTLALETLTFHESAVVHDVAIGCGHSNKGMFVGAAGLLGLGGGSMSFVGQLGGQAGGAFSYCLVSRRSGSGSGSGTLEFGRGAMPVGATWIPLVRNPRAPSFYYVGLSGLGVGGVRVPVPEDLFRLTELGDGGVVMDTGTAVTRLPGPAYAALRDAFVAQAGDLPRTGSGVSIFDTCYNLNGFVSVRVPTVSFYFSEGPVLTLPANNFLIPVDDGGTFCLAFAASASRLSIIGNVQQQGIQISFDGANGFAGFGPNVC